MSIEDTRKYILRVLTGTSVFRHFFHVRRIFAGEPEPDYAAPVVRYLQELQVDLFVDGHGPAAERHAFAEAVHTPGDEAVLVQPHVIAVNVVESQWRQVRVDGAGSRFRRCKREKKILLAKAILKY